MNEEWLPDRRGLAMNHFFTLMQVWTATESAMEGNNELYLEDTERERNFI